MAGIHKKKFNNLFSMKQKMAQETRHISIIGLVLIMLLPLLPTKAGNVVDENLPLAVRFCQSQMLSHPDYKTIDFNTKLKWNYTTAAT